MNTSSLSAFAPVLVALALVGAGCTNPITAAKQKVTESVVASVTGGKVKMDSEEGGATFTNPETGAKMAIGEDLKIPDTFPKDVPIYVGAKAKAVVMGDDGQKGATISLQTADAPKMVIDWYEKTLTGAGWKQTSTFNANGSYLNVYQKENARMAITVASDSGSSGSSITVVRSEEKK
jgi:hypothetical protein